jgi:hypothetical protein
MENPISSQTVQIERKEFTVDFRENERGCFLRIIEDSHGRRNTIIVPSTGLAEFTAAVNAVVAAAQATQATHPGLTPQPAP